MGGRGEVSWRCFSDVFSGRNFRSFLASLNVPHNSPKAHTDFCLVTGILTHENDDRAVDPALIPSEGV